MCFVVTDKGFQPSRVNGERVDISVPMVQSRAVVPPSLLASLLVSFCEKPVHLHQKSSSLYPKFPDRKGAAALLGGVTIPFPFNKKCFHVESFHLILLSAS